MSSSSTRATSKRPRDGGSKSVDSKDNGAIIVNKKSKINTGSKSTDNSLESLSATALHACPDSQLLSLLFTHHRVLRTAVAPGSVDPAFVKELVSSRYLGSSLADVQQMTGCLIADLVRLGNSKSRDSMGGVPSGKDGDLPFESPHADDVLSCLIAPFEKVARGEAPLGSCKHLIERAAASRVFLYIIPHCRREIGTRVDALFTSVQFATGSRGPDGVPINDDTALTGMAATEMARVLSDILHATHVTSSEQLAPLLREITAASPTLLRHKSNSANPPPSRSSMGALIAARVLVEQVDMIQPALATFALEVLEGGVAKVTAAERGGEAEKKRTGLRDVGRVLEDLVALTELHVGLVTQFLPGVLPFLENDSAEVRLLMLRGVAMALSANDGAASAYRPAVAALLARFADVRHTVRIEMVQMAVNWVRMAARVAFSLVEERWRDLMPHMEQRLLDPHVPVRRATVLAYGEIVAAAPSLIPSERLERTLGLRVADKNPKVRQAAVEQLCVIYQAQLFSWIPDAIMRSLNVEGGVSILEVAFENLLPSPSKVSTALAVTATVTVTSASVTHTPLNVHKGKSRSSTGDGHSSTASSHNNNNNNTNNSSGNGGTRRSGRADMAVFDFERESERRERTYADAIARLCAHMSSNSFDRLLAFAAKKAQLRLTIRRLFELRSVVRHTDPRSPEGQDLINKIHRLLSFLQSITHAERGEWDALFRAKDERIAKAFFQACADGLNYGTQREALSSALKGRVDGAVLRFVQESLTRQMMLPIDATHVDELLARLQDVLHEVCREESETSLTSEVQSEVKGLLRALLVIARTAPPLLPRCALSLLEFVPLLCNEDHVGRENGAMKAEWLQLLFRCITEWASGPSPLHYNGKQRSAMSKDMANTHREEEKAAEEEEEEEEEMDHRDLKHQEAIEARVQLALTSLSVLCTGDHAFTFTKADVSLFGAVCKQAARALMALLALPGLSPDARTLSRLVDALRHRLYAPTDLTMVGRLKTITALAKDPRAAPLVQDDKIVQSVVELLLSVVREPAKGLESARPPRVVSDTPPLSLPSAAADAAAKSVSAIALSYAPERAAGASATALSALLSAYKAAAAAANGMEGGSGAAAEREAHTWAACRRRLALNQQLARLVVRPSTDMGRELAVAVILSAEDELMVRQPVQRKMAHHLMQSICDMRYAAFLILTAIAEDTRGGYQQLRLLVQRVGDHLRSKQVASGATLSSPSALSCFLEYAIPFLVLFMAHHTFYSSEQENHFVAFQRVWHLLFDELFRRGTQCASFVVELFSRIKQSDDVLDRESHTTRVLCDLGMRVMHEQLGQRQISAEALKRYPGRVLLPNFFVPSKSATTALQTVYLDPKIHIFNHAPFRPPTSALTASNSAAATGGGAAATPRHSVARSDGAGNSSTAGSPPPKATSVSANTMRRVTVVLDELVEGMTRKEIAGLQWKAVQQHLIEAMLSNGGDSDSEDRHDNENEEEETAAANRREAVLVYARQRLRQHYERAAA